eukprot:1467100-Pleurochrysis_carterae.AAC.1
MATGVTVLVAVATAAATAVAAALAGVARTIEKVNLWNAVFARVWTLLRLEWRGNACWSGEATLAATHEALRPQRVAALYRPKKRSS